MEPVIDQTEDFETYAINHAIVKDSIWTFRGKIINKFYGKLERDKRWKRQRFDDKFAEHEFP